MNKPNLLLHSCYGPCSTSVIDCLQEGYNLTIFYYNPNIYPQKEYKKRLEEQKKYIKLSNKNINVIDGEYVDNNIFEKAFCGFENSPEGGSRCEKCIYLRMKKTAEKAMQLNFDLFATTLSVSPHKNAKMINEIGKSLQEEYGINYLESDFKKKDGYLKSIQITKC